ncbi:MAG: dehydrogenase [Acidimicrobiia bacterium]|nr:dehydrogenase [Acidimicrobiia bacterium]
MSVFPYLVAAWLFIVGLYGLVTSRNLIHLIACLTVVQSSTYIALLSIGYQRGGAAPIYKEIPTSTPAVDPLVAALTLTDVVVGAVVTALLLAFAVQTKKRSGTLDPNELRDLQQ